MIVKVFACVVVLSLLVAFPLEQALASSSSSDILKQGLLGAGSGAIGGAASGAKGKDVWKGALAGAGVNIVGGALLDSLSGEKVDNTQRVDSSTSRDAYSGGYQDGYQNGYKAGYTEGYKEGLRDGMSGR
jgi:hypothetical protein